VESIAGSSVIRVGPGSLPSRETAEEAIELLVFRGYGACEIDFGDGFWMDWDYAHRLGQLAPQAGVALSIHAPLAAFLGHAEYGGRKHHMAIGMLDHSAGIAVACGAAPVVIHPGFLLGREHAQAIDAVVVQLGELRERLAAKGRDVPVWRRGDGTGARARLTRRRDRDLPPAQAVEHGCSDVESG